MDALSTWQGVLEWATSTFVEDECDRGEFDADEVKIAMRIAENERLRCKVDSLFKEFPGYKEINSGFTDASFILQHLAAAIEGDGDA